jgi:hypothetical protein
MRCASDSMRMCGNAHVRRHGCTTIVPTETRNPSRPCDPRLAANLPSSLGNGFTHEGHTSFVEPARAELDAVDRLKKIFR